MRRLSGFSLMEMMTVLLIVSVVAAASAPMINKRMMVNQAAGDCLWEQLGDGSIAFNQNTENISVIIGANGINNNNNLSPKLHIKTNDGDPFITFERDGVNNQLALNYRANTLGLSANNPTDGGTAIGANANANGRNSIAVGRSANALGGGATAVGENVDANGRSSIAIGDDFTRADKDYSIAIGNYTKALSENSIAIGRTATADNKNSIAIGTEAKTGFNSSVAIGFQTLANGTATVAIGTTANARGINSTAIGAGAKAEAEGCIAIGTTARASREENEVNGVPAFYSIAIGEEAEARMPNSIAIGHGAIATKENQIVLGATADKTRHQQDYTVYIPGNLVVGGDVLLNAEKGTVVLRTLESEEEDFDRREHVSGYFQNPTGLTFFKSHDYHGRDDNLSEYMKCKDRDNDNRKWFSREQVEFFDSYIDSTTITNSPDTADSGEAIVSDRRLKNVGKAFTSGLAEIKKLEVFNYTFKKDESKTPRVGVMAQDLQKIFPNAVTKGEDGFLRIRMEDMFYAVVNAVKELDNKFDLLAQKQKKIDELEAKLDKLEKRLEKLEKQK